MYNILDKKKKTQRTKLSCSMKMPGSNKLLKKSVDEEIELLKETEQSEFLRDLNQTRTLSKKGNDPSK